MRESGRGERWDLKMECEMGGEGLLAEGGWTKGARRRGEGVVLRKLAREEQEFWEFKGDSR